MMKYIKSLFVLILMAVAGGCTDNYKSCDTIGCEYLGMQYVSDPLGEEIFPDTDPLIRLDAFDCVTFVETALARGDKNKLNHIRYKDGQIGFLNRNHFTELDWINNNADLISEVTQLYGSVKTRHVRIDKQAWFKKVHNIETNIEPVDIDLKYLPYGSFDHIKTDVPLIVLFVVDNPAVSEKIGTDIAISHMGFVMPNGMLRHASSKAEAVVDTDFMQYIQRRAENKQNLGIALFGIK